MQAVRVNDARVNWTFETKSKRTNNNKILLFNIKVFVSLFRYHRYDFFLALIVLSFSFFFKKIFHFVHPSNPHSVRINNFQNSFSTRSLNFDSFKWILTELKSLKVAFYHFEKNCAIMLENVQILPASIVITSLEPAPSTTYRMKIT